MNSLFDQIPKERIENTLKDAKGVIVVGVKKDTLAVTREGHFSPKDFLELAYRMFNYAGEKMDKKQYAFALLMLIEKIQESIETHEPERENGMEQ